MSIDHPAWDKAIGELESIRQFLDNAESEYANAKRIARERMRQAMVALGNSLPADKRVDAATQLYSEHKDIPATLISDGLGFAHQNTMIKEIRQARNPHLSLAESEYRRYRLKNDTRLPATYREYLQTPYWINRRISTISQTGNVCQHCGAQHVRLYVHHMTYERVGGELPSDLIVLCWDCHSWFPTNEVKA